MSTAPPIARAVRFGPFELEFDTAELRRSGLKLRLQEQPFRVLAMLVQRPGELVTRRELCHALWPESVFVDQEHGLNIAVAKLRRTLGDTAAAQRYVETLERRGYRFIASVHPVVAQAASLAVSERAAVPRIVRVVWGRRSIALSEGIHVIGRDPTAEIWIDSPLVSRRHVALTISAATTSVEDLGSRNGTLVNGLPITASRDVIDGDIVTVGSTQLVIRTESATGTTRIVRRP